MTVRDLFGFVSCVSAIVLLSHCSSSSSSDDSSVATDDGGSRDDASSANDGGEEKDGSAGTDGSVAFTAAKIDLLGCPQAGYAGTFAVGGNPFALVVDTGSAELGVASASCSNCGVSPTYTPSASAVDQDASVSISYVSGSGWSGDVVRDSFGAPSPSTVTAPTKLVAIDSSSGGFFTNGGCGFGTVPFAYQGIAGFGPASLAEPGTDEPMSALANAGTPDVFSFALCDGKGALWLGGAPSGATPKWTPLLDADNYYGIAVHDLVLGGTAIGTTASAIGDVVVDTDTTEFELPTAVYDSLRDAIQANAKFQQHISTSGNYFDNGACGVSIDGATAAQIDADLPPLALRLDDGAGGTFDVTLSATHSYLDPVVKNGTTYYCPEIEPKLGRGMPERP